MNVFTRHTTTNPTRFERAKAFVLHHGEKVAFGVVTVLAIMFAFKSLTLPRLAEEYQANSLRKTIAQTHEVLTNYQWEHALNSGFVNRYEEIPAIDDQDVVSERYEPKGGFKINSFVVAPTATRTDPLILNASEVYATGGTGLFAFLDEEVRKRHELDKALFAERMQWSQQKQQAEEDRSLVDQSFQPYDPNHPRRRPIDSSLRIPGVPLQGDERIERAYWACVVALVPVREQFKLYLDSFEKARGYDVNRDFPRYLGFLVERAEISRDKPLEWRHVPLYDGQQKSIAANETLSTSPRHGIGTAALNKLYTAATQFWAGGLVQDVVDARFTNQILTLPLPPLVGRDWGKDVTHPGLRFNSPEIREVSEPPISTTGQQDTFASVFRNPNVPPPSAQSPQFMSNRAGGVGSESVSYRSRGIRGDVESIYRGIAPASVADGRETLPVGVDHYLLRFFDFTVEKGKNYKYRVKLAIADPNYNMPPSTLTPKVLDRQAQAAKLNHGRKPSFRVADDWSDPSPTVGIPIGGRIRLASAKPQSPEKIHDEPSASVIIEAFAIDEDGNAIKAATEEQNVRRGSVANLVKDAEYLGPGYIDFRQNFRFVTGMMLLDMEGGAKLTRDIIAPSRILLMGPTGQLYVQKELDDKPFVEHHRLIFEKSDARRRGPGGRIARRSD